MLKIIDIKNSVAEARNEYTYLADGQKLKMIQKYNPDYLKTPVLGSDVTLSALMVTKTTDYLGNNRIVANASGEIVQKNHCYPFGMPFADTPML